MSVEAADHFAMPSLRSPFVGRTVEMADLRARTASPGAVVVCWGPPGIGKTRLVLELLDRTPLTGAFASLMSCTDEASVLSAVAKEIGALLARASDAVEAIGARLRADAAPSVVVLDNAEHVAAVIPAMIERLRCAAPSVRWIVTSSSALALPGATLIEVAPLAQGDARALLMHRVEAFAGDHVSIDHESLLVVARAVDCIPLALELVAPRVALLGVQSTLKAIGERRSRLLSPTDSSLGRATMASWRLLSDREQDLLARLWPFRGEFTEEDVAAVASCAESAGHLLQELVRRSFVVRAGRGPQRSFRLLWSVREFAEARCVEVGLAAAARAAHALRCVTAGDALAIRLRGWQPADALIELRRMREDMRFALDVGSIDQRARLLLHLEAILEIDGPLWQLVPDCETALAARGDDGALSASAESARFLIDAIRASAQRRAGDHDAAAATALALLSRGACGGESAEARVRAHETLGFVALARGDVTSAWASVAAIEQEMDASDPFQRMRAHLLRATYLTAAGQQEDAIVEIERAVWVAKDARCARQVVRLSLTLGAAYVERGCVSEAQFMLDQALLAMGRRETQQFAYSVAVLRGMMHHMKGELVAAHQSYAVAAREAEMLGLPWLAAIQRGYAAFADLERGAVDDALASLPAAIDCLRSAGERRNQSMFLGLLAVAHAHGGQVQLARSSFERAKQLVSDEPTSQDNITLDRFERCVSALRPSGSTLVRADQAASMPETVVSFDSMLATRLVARLLDPKSVQQRCESSALVVGPAFEWMRPPSCPPVDLTQKPILRLLLRTLVDARVRDPAATVSREQIQAALWPEIRLSEHVAGNRIRVAITTLRNLGLRGRLPHRAGGWCLAVPVVLMD